MKVAIIQLCSKNEAEKNLAVIDRLLENIGAEIAFLPESFLSMSDGKKATKDLITNENSFLAQLKALAIKHKIALIGGSAATLGNNGEILNRAYNFSSEGKDLGAYDKNHLFACDLGDRVVTESEIYTPGTGQHIVRHGVWKIGIGICFDIRFSDHALRYIHQGCQILTFASAFTIPTGQAHWHILNRARAIEGQCYVISAAQVGKHNERVSTYGHSLVVDPWGEILLDLGETPNTVGVVDLDIELVNRTRRKVLMNA